VSSRSYTDGDWQKQSPKHNVSETSQSSLEILSGAVRSDIWGEGEEDRSSQKIDEINAAAIVQKLLPRSTIPTTIDKNVIERRQLVYPVKRILAVEASKCKHGFPRAFVQYPIDGERSSSGQLRLSCPHLVKAVDEYEIAGGGIKFFNDLMAMPENEQLRENFVATNYRWKAIREASISAREEEVICEKLGQHGKDQFMNSGIIGITLEKTDDVKCLHAHVADELVRGDNKIGQQTLEILDQRGINARGCDG
jgi:hypothetical protein